MPFYDRKEAGQKLAFAIENCKLKIENSVILALPRGGVIIGREIANTLNLPLDVLIVRKIGYPGNPEFAVGAVGESGRLVLGEEERSVDTDYLKKEVAKEKEEIKRRLKEYRGERPKPVLKNKIVIIVDDGLATGLSMKAAISEVRRENPSKIVVAVPVAPAETIKELKNEADEIICLETPSPFFAIGNFYTNFAQVSDQEVKEALEK